MANLSSRPSSLYYPSESATLVARRHMLKRRRSSNEIMWGMLPAVSSILNTRHKIHIHIGHPGM